jgi:hypothetical protein
MAESRDAAQRPPMGDFEALFDRGVADGSPIVPPTRDRRRRDGLTPVAQKPIFEGGGPP